VNSILAKREALLDGYDEAILLDTQGLVSEASGENIFVVRDGVIATPTLHSVLGGITRSTVIDLARDKASRSRSARSRATSSTSPTRYS
jgi:branched-chain amino acid aminotransferase